MLFNTATFFWFLVSTLAIYYLIPGRYVALRTGFLLVASYSFYLHWEVWYFFLLAPITLVNYVAGLWLERADPPQRKHVLAAAVGASLGLLAVSKYTDFVLGTVAEFATARGFELRFEQQIEALPLGISFFTFQALSYSIDVYRRRIEPEHNLVRFALFVAFFPQLVAGPIEKAHNLLTQLRERIGVAKPLDPLAACEQIAFGLFKKLAIADNIGPLVAPVFASPESYTASSLALAAVLFSIQIYSDFSGYTDIAIGTARLFGIRLQKNFDFPYFARNITDFWRRWHISLSSWLKEYLYISLGGNRHGVARMYAALIVTMLLGGLWHGPSWNFVLWGACQGLYLVAHKLYAARIGLTLPPLVERYIWALSVPTTFVLVTLTWVPFVCPDIGTTLTYLSRLFTWSTADGAIEQAALMPLLLTIGLLMFADLTRFLHASRVQEASSALNNAEEATLVHCVTIPFWLLLAILFSAPEGQQFIYFAF